LLLFGPERSILAVYPPTPLPRSAFRVVTEVPGTDLPSVVHPTWRDELPWLVQGTTTCGSGEPFDLGLFSHASTAQDALERWDELRRHAGLPVAVHAHQVHGAAVRFHRVGSPGLQLVEACDGHVTADPGVLLVVTVADCVPVSLVVPKRRAVALLHVGWRGAAAGILERGLEVLRERLGPGEVWAHMGPSICGRCYEVGPEVFRSLGLAAPPSPRPLDLRGWLAGRAVALGVPEDRVTLSSHCTRCGDANLFSHRGGDAARQVGYLGITR
jgi:copper oxidase (laccase) domain-containing protein